MARIQYQVDDKTLFTVDALYSYFARQSQSTDVTSPAFGINGTGSNLAPNGAPPLKANTLGTGNINIINYAVNEAQNNLTDLPRRMWALPLKHLGPKVRLDFRRSPRT